MSFANRDYLILQAVKSFEKTVLTPLNNTDGKDLYG
jgi:hypothetical protein